MNNTPMLIMLVGLPGSGKSTYISSLKIEQEFVILSTDNFLEEEAIRLFKTYSEIFSPKMMADAHTAMYDTMRQSVKDCKHLMWDQTNVTKATRADKLQRFMKEPNAHLYTKRAIYFDTPYETCLARIKNRPGKVIPQRVMWSMNNQLEPPTKEEGFDGVAIWKEEAEKA